MAKKNTSNATPDKKPAEMKPEVKADNIVQESQAVRTESKPVEVETVATEPTPVEETNVPDLSDSDGIVQEAQAVNTSQTEVERKDFQTSQDSFVEEGEENTPGAKHAKEVLKSNNKIIQEAQRVRTADSRGANNPKPSVGNDPALSQFEDQDMSEADKAKAFDELAAIYKDPQYSEMNHLNQRRQLRNSWEPMFLALEKHTGGDGLL